MEMESKERRILTGGTIMTIGRNLALEKFSAMTPATNLSNSGEDALAYLFLEAQSGDYLIVIIEPSSTN